MRTGTCSSDLLCTAQWLMGQWFLGSRCRKLFKKHFCLWVEPVKHVFPPICLWGAPGPSSNTLTFQSRGILPLHIPPERCRRINAHECEAAPPSPKVGQRHPICCLGRLHFGQEHRVGSARHFLSDAALDGGQRVAQERSTECSIRDAHVVELVRARTGEGAGQRALMLPQNVDREDLRQGNGLAGVRCLVNTDEQHGWVERERRDGAGREAVVDPLVLRCDDGHSAGEVAHDTPKAFSIDKAMLFLGDSIRRAFHFSSDHGAGAYVLRHSMPVNTVVPVLTLLSGWLPFLHSLARTTRIARASTNALRCRRCWVPGRRGCARRVQDWCWEEPCPVGSRPEYPVRSAGWAHYCRSTIPHWPYSGCRYPPCPAEPPC